MNLPFWVSMRSLRSVPDAISRYRETLVSGQEGLEDALFYETRKDFWHFYAFPRTELREDGAIARPVIYQLPKTTFCKLYEPLKKAAFPGTDDKTRKSTSAINSYLGTYAANQSRENALYLDFADLEALKQALESFAKAGPMAGSEFLRRVKIDTETGRKFLQNPPSAYPARLLELERILYSGILNRDKRWRFLTLPLLKDFLWEGFLIVVAREEVISQSLPQILALLPYISEKVLSKRAHFKDSANLKYNSILLRYIDLSWKYFAVEGYYYVSLGKDKTLTLTKDKNCFRGAGELVRFDLGAFPVRLCLKSKADDCRSRESALDFLKGRFEDMFEPECALHRKNRRTALTSLISQSLSHNIGSHALADARLFDPEDSDECAQVKGLHQYLQARLDYIAHLNSAGRQLCEPMYLWGEMLRGFVSQALLLNRLLEDRSVRGENLCFRIFTGASEDPVIVNWSDIEAAARPGGDPLRLPEGDIVVAVPSGAIGCHAFYSILENLMRNSVKYGKLREGRSDLVVSLRIRSPGENDDFWMLEVWDNFSGFDRLSEGNVYREIVKTFESDVVDAEGRVSAGGHGLLEIKEAMRFLYSREESDDWNRRVEAIPFACRPCHRTSPGHGVDVCGPDCRRTARSCCFAHLANVFDEDYDGRQPGDGVTGDDARGTLVYRVRLRRPRLLGVWCPKVEFDERQAQDVAQGVFFRKDLLSPGPGDTPTLADLAPHLLVIRDHPSLPENADTEKEACIKRICALLAMQHWQLPYRLFVVTADDDRKKLWEEEINKWVIGGPEKGLGAGLLAQGDFLPYNRVRVISDAACHAALGDPCGSAKNLTLVNHVYDTWLRAYKPTPDEEPWHLIICFERGEEVITDRWKPHLLKAFHDKAQNLGRKPWAVCSVFHKPVSSDPFGEKSSGIDYRGANGEGGAPPPGARVIHFGNHGSEPPELKRAWDRGELHFTQAFGSVHGPRTFHHLYSPPQEEQALRFYLYSIMEAALTKVLIFDERVFSSVFKDGPASGGGHEISLSRIADAWGSGLLPALQIPSGTDKCARARSDVCIPSLEEPQSFYLPASNLAATSLKWAALGIRDLDSARRTMREEVSSHKARYDNAEEPKVTADIIAVHEGLVEELVSHSTFAKGTDLNLLAIAPRILRFSGKGPEARKLSSRHPFAEYSAISACVTPYRTRDRDNNEREALRIEKVFLGKAVLNSIGTLPSTLRSI